MSENDRKRPNASLLRAVLLVCAAAVVVFFALIPRTPPDVRRAAIAHHTLSWIRHRLHQNWISGTAFLPEGRHDWGTTYAFQIAVMATPAEMEQTPALTATVQYDDLSEGLVVVNVDRGQVYEFDKRIDRFGEPKLSARVDRDTWETVYLYVYGPSP